MSSLLIFTCGVAAFMLGFTLGIFYGSPPKGSLKESVKPPDAEALRKLNEEYRNFLSYDGSEQT